MYYAVIRHEGNPKTYMNIGEAIGQAMVKLLLQ
jgi:hypothetical protein